jgi:hypothetical protein
MERLGEGPRAWVCRARCFSSRAPLRTAGFRHSGPLDQGLPGGREGRHARSPGHDSVFRLGGARGGAVEPRHAQRPPAAAATRRRHACAAQPARPAACSAASSRRANRASATCAGEPHPPRDASGRPSATGRRSTLGPAPARGCRPAGAQPDGSRSGRSRCRGCRRCGPPAGTSPTARATGADHRRRLGPALAAFRLAALR